LVRREGLDQTLIPTHIALKELTHMRRALAVLASIGLGIGTVALATPAHAASYSFNPDCTSIAPPVSQTAVTGDTLDFTGMTGKGCVTLRISKEIVGSAGDVTVVITGGTVSETESVSDFSWQVNAGEFSSVTVRLAFSGLNQGPIVFQDAAAPAQGDFTVNVSGGGGDDSGSSGASGSAPAAVIQQFGLPASGNCEDGATEAMNWSGIPNGGWGISWARWMNDGAGGAVCTRTVVYDTSSAKWVVN